MAKTYYLDLTNGTHSIGGQFTHELAVALGSIQTDSILAANAGGVQSGYYEEPEGTEVTRTSNGTFGVEVNISTATANTQMSMQLHRVNSGGTIQNSSGHTAYQATTSTGLLNFSHVLTTELGTFATTDRLVVELRVQNNAPHGADKGPTHDLETVNAEVTTPFSDPAGGGGQPAMHYINLMRG